MNAEVVNHPIVLAAVAELESMPLGCRVAVDVVRRAEVSCISVTLRVPFESVSYEVNLPLPADSDGIEAVAERVANAMREAYAIRLALTPDEVARRTVGRGA